MMDEEDDVTVSSWQGPRQNGYTLTCSVFDDPIMFKKELKEIPFHQKLNAKFNKGRNYGA